MTDYFNLKTVANELPDEIRNHPVPRVYFYGQPQFSKTLFKETYTNPNDGKSMIMEHNLTYKSFPRNPLREVFRVAEEEQKGLIKVSWFQKHTQVLPAGLILFFI